eukprot:4647426-Karenia_brevis.AAC.1
MNSIERVCPRWDVCSLLEIDGLTSDKEWRAHSPHWSAIVSPQHGRKFAVLVRRRIQHLITYVRIYD